MNKFVFLSVCLVVVSALSSRFPDDLETRERKAKQCLIKYKINPDAATLEMGDDDTDEVYNKLSELQKACVTVCHYKSFGAVRPDGSLDTEHEIVAEASTEEELAEYRKSVNRCKAEAGRDDCKFILCLEKLTA